MLNQYLRAQQKHYHSNSQSDSSGRSQKVIRNARRLLVENRNKPFNAGQTFGAAASALRAGNANNLMAAWHQMGKVMVCCTAILAHWCSGHPGVRLMVGLSQEFSGALLPMTLTSLSQDEFLAIIASRKLKGRLIFTILHCGRAHWALFSLPICFCAPRAQTKMPTGQ